MSGRTYHRLTERDRELIARMRGEKIPYEVIARVIGCSMSRVVQVTKGYVAVKGPSGRWTVEKPKDSNA